MKCIKTKLKLNNKQNIDRDLSESINLRNTVCLRVNIYGSPAADSSGGSRKSTLKYHYKECYNTKYNGC